MLVPEPSHNWIVPELTPHTSPTASPIVSGASLSLPVGEQSFLFTLTLFERSKQPVRSAALAPTVAPPKSPSKDRCHTKHSPTPAISKLTAENEYCF